MAASRSAAISACAALPPERLLIGADGCSAHLSKWLRKRAERNGLPPVVPQVQASQRRAYAEHGLTKAAGRFLRIRYLL